MNTKATHNPRANVLVLGANSLHALVPATLIAQADALLDRHRLDEAVDLADRQLKRLQSRVSVSQEEVRGYSSITPCAQTLPYHDVQADELRYVYQRLGFQCLTETLFDDAGKHFFAGNLDPRVLIHYYPHLCGGLFTADDTADVFAGVAEHMPAEDSIDEISECPSLAPAPFPCPRAASSGSHLNRRFPSLPPRRAVRAVARPLRALTRSSHQPSPELLAAPRAEHEHRARDGRAARGARRRRGGHAQALPAQVAREAPRRGGQPARERGASPALRGAHWVGADARRQVVDTVLGRLYTESGETTDLLALVDGPNDIVLPVLAPVLVARGRYDALCRLYRARGLDDALLDAWAKCVPLLSSPMWCAGC